MTWRQEVDIAAELVAQEYRERADKAEKRADEEKQRADSSVKRADGYLKILKAHGLA